MNNKKILAVITATIAASLCCITPVLAVLAGSSTLASSFSWLAPYHSYLVWFTVLVLLYAWYDKLKPSKEIDCDCDAKTGFFSSKKFLAIVTVFSVIMLSFPQWGNKVFDTAPSAESCASGACESTVGQEKTTVKEAKFKTAAVASAKMGAGCQTKSDCNAKPFKNAIKRPESKKPTDEKALTVFKYMQNEKLHPTPYKQKACTGYGRPEIDGMMADARSKVEEMSPIVLKKMIDNEDEFILLDVREVAQRSEGEIYADDVVQMTRGDLEFMIMNKIKNKDAVIVTYDRTGGRGLLAAETLKEMGYNNVYTLKGGLKAWAKAGLPFDSGLGIVVKVEDE
ncbi:rhodanese-like domain-containing protein [Sulfurovum sp.]|uniref:rhodanese-like domain-containing protein n=1 Tax=Sulfurovum sp. TaxID=1969726 RepID=UPI0025F54968|nr:rhodanese-like domain-containing protein [Sulfurovum sp.]